MVTSIGGPNERWGQIAALQPQQTAQPGSVGGPAFGNGGTTTTDPPLISPVAGSTASPLSSETNFLLTMFSGGTGSSPSLAPQQGPSGAAGQSQPDAPLSLSAPTLNADADAITGNRFVQKLQALVSGSGPSASNGGSVSSTPGGGDAIGNSGTAVPSWHNGWDNTFGPGDLGRQQAGLAAYASGDFSNQDNVTASVLQGITA